MRRSLPCSRAEIASSTRPPLRRFVLTLAALAAVLGWEPRIACAAPSRAALNGVVDWQPGRGFFHSQACSFGADPGDDKRALIPYSITGFEDVVVDSGAMVSAWLDPDHPWRNAHGQVKWWLRLSATGAETRFAANVDGVNAAQGFGTADLSEYDFTLDAPTEVTLSLSAIGTSNPSYNQNAAFQVRPFVGSPGSIVNLFPAFDLDANQLPLYGTRVESQFLPAGAYEFRSTVYAQGVGNADTVAFAGATARVVLQFGAPVTEVSPAPGVGPVEVALVPNPSHGRSTISLAIPRDSDVEIALYDVTGRRAETIRRSHMTAGRAGFTWQPSRPLTGVYLLSVRGDGFAIARRVVFVR